MLLALAEVLRVLRHDLLLALDKFRYGYRLIGDVGINGHLLSELLLLVGYPADLGAAVVEGLFLLFQLVELITYADDVQQGISFLLCGLVHELRKIEGKALDEAVQQRLSALVTVGVDNFQRTVLPGALDHYAVIQRDFQVRFYHRALTHR